MNNLFLAWQEFKRGKSKKEDLQEFDFNLGDNLWQLHYDLKTQNYQPASYQSFYVSDPKLRHIHKACVRDRVVHQALYRILSPLFDRQFIFDSYSCRIDKGTHKAVNRLANFCRKESKNYSKVVYGLKCDVKKFFDSIDQTVLRGLLTQKIEDKNTLWLIDKIINSFAKADGKGLPLGNVTSQLFANIYLNELDQFVKRQLKVKYYLRYTDDFVIVSRDERYLADLVKQIDCFLQNRLLLNLHPQKVFIRRFSQGLDFLGYVVLPHHRVLRTKTKRRLLRKIEHKKRLLSVGSLKEESFEQTLSSYYGVLSHCRGYKIKRRIASLLGGHS